MKRVSITLYTVGRIEKGNDRNVVVCRSHVAFVRLM